MMSMGCRSSEARARRLSDALTAEGVPCTVEVGESRAGGGSLPGKGLESRVVRIEHSHAHDVHHALRTGSRPVVARVADGALWLDVRTVTDAQLDDLPGLVALAWHRG